MFVFPVSSDCYVPLPRDAMGSSAVCDLVLPGHTHYFQTYD